MAAMARQARVQMEMGGKNPLVVLADADLDRAVAIALDGGFFQTGQRCTASSRVIVEDAIHDRFVAALAERAQALKVGAALDPDTQVGPAASEQQFRSEEHTSELQSLMRISYAVFCLTKKRINNECTRE